MTTVAQALAEGAELLDASSPSARLDAEVLLGHAARRSRTQLIAHADTVLDDAARERYAQLLARRARGEPVAYLTGTREFWSLPLRVTPAVLIPRPETELLVEHALSRLPTDRACLVADIGTGSGAIAVALAHERPRARVIATDASPEAIAVARANAEAAGCDNVEFRLGEWLAPIAHERADLIVSNPPYIAADDAHLLEGDVRFEPRAALVGGADGLDGFRVIGEQARSHLVPGGWLMLEHGWDQKTALRKLLLDLGYGDIACFADDAGHDRVTQARLRP